jgi:hypothetical protein
VGPYGRHAGLAPAHARCYEEAITAEVNRGKALGFYVTRSEAGRPGEFSNLTDADLDAKIAALGVIHKAKNPGPKTPAADA